MGPPNSFGKGGQKYQLLEPREWSMGWGGNSWATPLPIKSSHVCYETFNIYGYWQHTESEGCTHGDVLSPLLGGASDDEGVVEVCVNGIYLPVSLDNGNFSTREASIICKQLMPQFNKGTTWLYRIIVMEQKVLIVNSSYVCALASHPVHSSLFTH